MKKLILLSLLMISFVIVKAQYSTVNVINNSGRPDLYVYLLGNDGTFLPCTPTNTSSSIGPLAASTTYPYFPTTTPWSPATSSVISLTGIGFNIIPVMGPMEPGPAIGLCAGSIPPSPFNYVFSGGSRNSLSFSYPSPGAITVTVNP